MPTGQECFYCHKKILDWFREWYSDSEQRQLFKGLIAADCPDSECSKRVRLAYDVKEIDQDTPSLPRSRAAAENWVQNQKQGRFVDLTDFLRSNEPEAQTYRNYKFRP
jgi:hypothetical protein